MPRDAIRRLFRLPLRRRDLTEARVEEEISFHLEQRTERLIAQGLQPEAARREARRRLGSEHELRSVRRAALRRERRLRVRDWTADLMQDLRHAGRRLRGTPGFTTAALLTLALGIGAATAVFTVVEGVLLRPLPFPEPDRLVRVFEVNPEGDDHNVVSPGNYLDWQGTGAFTVLGAHRYPYGVSLTGEGEAARVRILDVAPAVMEALGRDALLGRRLLPEDAAGDGLVAVLSHGFWRSRFGADREIIGRKLLLNQQSVEVVGVMPEDFRLPTPEPDLYLPLTNGDLDPDERRGHMLYVIGRLAPGATVASAESELQTLAAGLARSYPEAMSGWSVNVEPLQGDMVAEARPLLVALMGAVALILLIACANVGNLLLARAVGRDREMTVRAALGAGRGRLVRQLLAEGLLLGTLGGALGLGAATVAMPLLLALAPADIPRIETVGLGSAAMAFALAATLASVLLFALLPALRITLPAGRTGLGTRDAGAGRVQARLQSAFLVGEIALSLVLLVTAGLLVRSAARLHQVELGFTSGALAAASLDLPGARYGGIEPATRFYAELTERVRAIPGVAAVTGTTEPPVVGFGMTFSFAIQGRPAGTASGREDDDNLRVVLPGYFETMGIPVLRGRGFMPQDRAGTTPVLIVNETLARKHWPDGGAVGALVSFAGPDEGPWWEIVGVVGDTRLASAAEAPIPAIYMPHAQRTWAWMSWLSLVVRTDPNVDPGGLGGAIRSVLRELDPDVPLHSLEPVEGLYEDSLAPRRFATLLLGSFAAFAMLLGAIGLYGVVSYNVAQRHRELGIRKALGAREGALVRLVLAQGLRVAVLGMALGAILALTGTRLVHSLLYGVSATDPLTYAAVSGLLLAVVLGASLVPALRAARTDPARVLRE